MLQYRFQDDKSTSRWVDIPLDTAWLEQVDILLERPLVEKVSVALGLDAIVIEYRKAE